MPSELSLSQLRNSLVVFSLGIFAVVACASSTTQSDRSRQNVQVGDPCFETDVSARAEDGCNTCLCEDGHWACTEIGCGSVEDNCSEGEERLEDCNTCVCADSWWQCTNMNCEAETKCEEGSTQPASDSCNSCVCIGGDWTCTLETCNPDPICHKGDKTDDGCNTCSCSANNTWACTRNACPVIICTDGDTRVADDGCNTCQCEDDIWNCTEKACTSDCGGVVGATCGPEQFCKYADTCNSPDALGLCLARPDVCIAIEDPVCGCDGKTYASLCAAQSAGVDIVDKGKCP